MSIIYIVNMFKKFINFILGESFIAQLIRQVIYGLIILYIIINFIFIPCVVDGSSMFPTLHQGDYGYSFIISRNIKINRFDIAVIKVHDDSDELLVKRIIGMPNETINYRDNKLYINNEYVEESFLTDEVSTGDFEITLGDDEYYMLGDNRNVSRDSRYYGPFNKKQIVSTHVFIIKPLANFGMKK